MTQERCTWQGTDPLYVAYHDTEWGVPHHDSRELFEKLILEGFQAGLSWITILKKRENFRQAFEGFHPEVLASWGEQDVERLLQNAGIVRHRGKIEATISGARAYLEIPDFSSYLWDFVDGTPIQNNFRTMSEVPAETPLSRKISKDLKSKGFKFCGPTIVYAFIQTSGLVNDHLTGCPRHKDLSPAA